MRTLLFRAWCLQLTAAAAGELQVTAARRQAASAVSISRAVTPAWVSIRTRPGTTVTRNPAASSRRIHSTAGQPVPATSTNTTLVWTLAGSTPARHDPGDALGQPPGVRVILGEPAGPSRSAIRPAAAMIPACRQAPPNRIFSRRASRMNSRLPASNDPIGAPSPLDRQNISASTCRVYSATAVPATTAALKMRAPSR